MKTFLKPIPANNNTTVSGSPLNDVVKVVEALVEIRSSVPAIAADINAADVASSNILMAQIVSLEKSLVTFQ